MLDILKEFLNEIIPDDRPASRPGAPSLRLAAAVLLMEVMRASDGVSIQERTAAARFLADAFELPDEEMTPLLQQAERESIAAYDYFRFTQPLDDGLSQDR